jgi:hypothetical protein
MGQAEWARSLSLARLYLHRVRPRASSSLYWLPYHVAQRIEQACRTRKGASHGRVRLCAAISLTDCLLLQTTRPWHPRQWEPLRLGFSLALALPLALPSLHHHGRAAGAIAGLPVHTIKTALHFRQSPPLSYRAKSVLQESAAFQNVWGGADGTSGHAGWRPSTHREKRHPRPWHNALSTHARMRMQRVQQPSSAGRTQALPARASSRFTRDLCATNCQAAKHVLAGGLVFVRGGEQPPVRSASLPKVWGSSGALSGAG